MKAFADVNWRQAMMRRSLTLPSLLRLWICTFGFLLATALANPSKHFESNNLTASHTSNYAVILSSSRYWFNYRHTTNALSVYQFLKRHGFSDDRIVLMIADEFAANDRNTFKNRLLTKGRAGPSLYDDATEIDYRGADVTVEALRRVLLGRPREPALPVLGSDARSHVLVYWTGHGGDEFFKFRDVEEITAHQIADTFDDMMRRHKFQELLFVVDTCQAFSLAKHITTPNVTAIASSLKGESSYAHHTDGDLGLSVTERYTAALVEFLTKRTAPSAPSPLDLSLRQALVDPYPYAVQRAHIGATDRTAVRKLEAARVRDFFVDVSWDRERSQTRANLEDDQETWVSLDAQGRGSQQRFFPPSRLESESTPAKRAATVSETETMCFPSDGESSPSESDLCPSPGSQPSREARALLEGRNPSDPVFLACAALVVSVLLWASRRYEPAISKRSKREGTRH